MDMVQDLVMMTKADFSIIIFAMVAIGMIMGIGTTVALYKSDVNKVKGRE